MTSTCVLVIGLPRTGTSMVAGLLHKLGVCMSHPGGDIPASPFNRRGYYEDPAFTEFHCRAIGTHKNDFLWTDHDKDYILGEPEQRTYWALIKDREDAHKYWGVKDPRIVHFIPYFINLRSAHLKVIETERDRGSTLASWRKVIAHNEAQPPWDIELLFDHWRMLKNRALFQLYRSGAQLVKLNYAGALQNAPAAVERAANFVGLPPTQAAINFIDPSLNHGSKEVA